MDWRPETRYLGWPALFEAAAVRDDPRPGIRQERFSRTVIGAVRAGRMADRLVEDLEADAR